MTNLVTSSHPRSESPCEADAFARPSSSRSPSVSGRWPAARSRWLGIVRQASDGAEALTNKAENTFKDVHGKVDAFGDRLKEKVKDLGEVLTTWKDDDEAAITPTSGVRVDPQPIVR